MYLLLFCTVLFISKIYSLDVMNLKSIYYQIYSNQNAHRIQNQSECVISQFSVPTEDSSIGFLFQGMKNNIILKMYGDIDFSHERYHQNNKSVCFNMNMSNFSKNQKEICFLDYDTGLNWILIGDPNYRLLNGLVHNRFSLDDIRQANESIRGYERNDVMVYDMKNCTFFNPMGLG